MTVVSKQENQSQNSNRLLTASTLKSTVPFQFSFFIRFSSNRGKNAVFPKIPVWCQDQLRFRACVKKLNSFAVVKIAPCREMHSGDNHKFVWTAETLQQEYPGRVQRHRCIERHGLTNLV